MRSLLSAGLLFIASGGFAVAAVRQFPWIRGHSARKPDPAQTRVAYHGTTVWSSEGRLYFPADKTPPPTITRAKSRAAKTPR